MQGPALEILFGGFLSKARISASFFLTIA